MLDSISEQAKAASQEAINEHTSAISESSLTVQDEGSAGSGGQEQSAEKPAYLSQITDDQWQKATPAEKDHLSTMGKSLYDDYQGKLKDLSPERKIRAALEEDRELGKLIQSYQDGTLNPSTQSGAETAKGTNGVVSTALEAGDLIDELKASDDPAVRVQAQKLELAINKRLENATGSNMKQELDSLKAMVVGLRGHQSQSHQQDIESKLDSLSAAWTPAIDKYREKLLAKANANPNVDFDHLLMITLTPPEYKAAIVADSSIEQKKQVNKAKQSAQVGAESVSGGKPLIGSENNKASGFGERTDFKSVISKLIPELRKNAPTG